MNDRDRSILQKIVEYCEQAIQTRAAFGDTLEAFSSSHIFQNACCMCILQIGELAGKLSEEARQASPDIPWREIRGMRNVFAHGYGTIILESTWETLQKDIPDLGEQDRLSTSSKANQYLDQILVNEWTYLIQIQISSYHLHTFHVLC